MTKALSKIWHSPAVQRFVPDKTYIKWEFKRRMGYALDLKNPQTFNEKTQWLKLYDRNPAYTRMVDKYEVRQYIADTIGKKYLVPLIGVYNDVDEIPFGDLPEEYVLKCTHDSGTAILKDKACILTESEIKRSLKKALKRKFYYEHREWPYKNINPRIICEKYLQHNIIDYKFMCFHGSPKYIQIHRNRYHGVHTLDFYDTAWNKTDIRRASPVADEKIPPPEHLDEMLELARVLSKDMISVRIDFYEVDNKVYFSEITFYTTSGLKAFQKREHDLQLGRLIKIPNIKGEKNYGKA